MQGFRRFWQITLHKTGYNSQYQTQFEEFSGLHQLALDPGNRWIQWGALLPWDRMVAIYQKKFSSYMGAEATDPRWVIGAFIIKHKLRLSDEETLQTISENPYMQFFLGLATYRPRPLFSPTLFVELRKKLGEEKFEQFSQILIILSSGARPAAGGQDSSPSTPKGKLKIDATVADQYIRYPNDLSLVNEARLKTEAIIDQLWELTKDQLEVKPTHLPVTGSQTVFEAGYQEKRLHRGPAQDHTAPAELHRTQSGAHRPYAGSDR